MSPRTYLLAAGAFTVGTSGYVISGLLPEVSRELHVSASAAGQLVTAFAIAYAVASPLLAAVTGRWERKKLVIAALITSAVGNALSAVAPTFELLLVSRVVAALGAAVFTPVATGMATSINPPERRGRAVAVVFGGLTTALVVGVPAGSLLGGPIGYHGVFALVAAASALAAVISAVWLPTVDAPPAVGVRERFAVLADSRVRMVLGMTVLGCLSAFAVFTFVAPLLATTAGLHGGAISVLLLCYGVGGAIGNTVGGRLADRYGSRRPLLWSFTPFVLILATLPLTAVTAVSAGIVFFLWGLCTWSVNPPIQNWLIELAPRASGLLLSINASAIYLGVGLSGVVGGFVIDSWGVVALPPVAAAVASLSFVLLVLAGRRDAAVAEREPELAAV
ncbi:MFS transporter [Actinokineospora globicatena]|uniref:MFS transporter n=1 Tax=Actinokineospora globicatena TaxID=103729 RepID=UPI0020A35A32|nr:MFS transporter [Actinokineospora globicatena]MCP2302774.1 putative arabinose efflux permease, MFS family [Actinokineospora globicatena]GLW75536.1 MFS transporter [Actinokineospora globicatena]GLW82377.1 MFS transporter [Actinokineospora globicatena]